MEEDDTDFYGTTSKDIGLRTSGSELLDAGHGPLMIICIEQ
jgi:hypothetical protein